MNGISGFGDLVDTGSIILGLDVAGKDQLLAAMADVAAATAGIAATPILATTILERVREREALGPTGFGQGAAIPHARLAGLLAVTAVVVRLHTGVEYGALDGEPVDMAVLLLSPEGAGADHLKALARVSRALRDPETLAAMRAAADIAAMRMAIGPQTLGAGQQAA